MFHKSHLPWGHVLIPFLIIHVLMRFVLPYLTSANNMQTTTGNKKVKHWQLKHDYNSLPWVHLVPSIVGCSDRISMKSHSAVHFPNSCFQLVSHHGISTVCSEHTACFCNTRRTNHLQTAHLCDLRFSWQWHWRLLSSRMWSCILQYIGTNVSREPAAYIFWLGDGGSRFSWNVGTYLPNYMALHPRRWSSLKHISGCTLQCHKNTIHS